MAERPDGQRVPAQVGEGMISLMLPDIDLELMRLIRVQTGYVTASGPTDHERQRGRDAEHRAEVHRELVELLSRIRDIGVDRAKLNEILGLIPEAVTTSDDTPACVDTITP
jgi:hypothetical protein